MRNLVLCVFVCWTLGCGQEPESNQPPPPPAADGLVVAHLTFTVDSEDPPVKAAEAWLIRTENEKQVRFDSSWWESAFRQDPTGPLMEMEHAQHLSGFFRDTPGWEVSRSSVETIYIELRPHMVDHNLNVQLRRDFSSSWGIATIAGPTELGTVEIMSIEWDELDD